MLNVQQLASCVGAEIARMLAVESHRVSSDELFAQPVKDHDVVAKLSHAPDSGSNCVSTRHGMALADDNRRGLPQWPVVLFLFLVLRALQLTTSALDIGSWAQGRQLRTLGN